MKNIMGRLEQSTTSCKLRKGNMFGDHQSMGHPMTNKVTKIIIIP